MILAGDIGGTHSRLALFGEDAGRLRLKREMIFFSRDHDGLAQIVNIFLREEAATVKTACFGIAGPVLQGRVSASNLAWIVDAQELSRQAGIATVRLVNDLEAHAAGIEDMEAADLVSLNSAAPGEGNAALIAAGTGLGEAGMYWNGSRRCAFAGEGGHADFAPRNDLEIALHQYLMKKFGHVSCERVLSGPGLQNIYDFLRDSGMEQEPEWLQAELLQAANPVAVISQYGLRETPPICARTLDVFVGAYGSEAGNLALKLLATGGVYVSGGIAAKILPRLRGPDFLEAFAAKGRMQPMLEKIPIKVVINDKVGLFGAARCALTAETGSPGSVVAP